MSLLNRSQAPISGDLWELIEEEAGEMLGLNLTARKIVDLEGPRGIEFSAVNTGLTKSLKSEGKTSLSLRESLPVLEIKIPFTVNRTELESALRGNEAADLEPVQTAARELARAENQITLYGLKEASITGIIPGAENSAVKVSDNISEFTGVVTGAISTLKQQGVGGPYSLLLTPEFYSSLHSAYNRGYPLDLRLEKILGGNVVLNPDLKEPGLLISRRGDDFKLIFGHKTAIGYNSHTSDEIEFFLFESFVLKVNGPEAVLPFK